MAKKELVLKQLGKKKGKVKIPRTWSNSEGTRKTLQTIKSKILGGDEQSIQYRTKESHTINTQRTSKKQLTKNSPSLKMKSEAGGDIENGWRENILHMEFEKMKEFEFYFNNNNASQVVKKINKIKRSKKRREINTHLRMVALQKFERIRTKI